MHLKNDKISKQFNSSAYQLLDKIGEGGFGYVYRATQMNTGQTVAIKFLSISSDFDENKRQRYIERFERETHLTSRLQHANIVRLLDKGTNGDLLFAVFEYVEGKTLKQTLTENGPMNASDAANVMKQVLEALAYAHQQGVIHRDIKPANIMLIESGTKMYAKVLDFGIATLVRDARVQDYKSITLTQETLGTPSYSSPEQLRGEPPTLKTDLYVWGLVFIECLTGKPAMSGSNLASVFHKQLSQDNVPIPAALVGHPLAVLLRRVLQKKAHQRSVNAIDLYQELVKINCANIVGELSFEKSINQQNPIALKNDDATLINTQPLFYTGKTERKQLTVMAVHLSAKLLLDKNTNFDDINHDVIDTLHRDQKNQCLDIATRYGAYHVGSLGDIQLYYFGYPGASDSDTRLCARTALDLVSSLNKRNALLKNSQCVEFEIKIGINTGLMTCYADATPDGDTANIALQITRLANNKQILCSATSQKILQSFIKFEPENSVTLGGALADTAIFNLVAERQAEAFGFLRAAKNNHLYIGRQLELKILVSRLKTNNESDFIHVMGEAGIGKSRLLFEFRNLATEHTHYIAQCLPEHVNNALYPILNVLKYKYALDNLESDTALAKLTDQVAQFRHINRADAMPILCAWLGYGLAENMAPSALSPDLQKQLLFSTLTALLTTSDYLQQSNLFIFEDMHWSDLTSIEFILYLTNNEHFQSSTDLFISTSREPLHDSLQLADYETIEVGKLAEQDTRDFVINLFDKQNVAPRLLNLVIERTDGVPLFVEELVDMLKQKCLVQHFNGITDFVEEDKIKLVPATLRDSLQQKLDTLLTSKETAQLAATIGREFDYALLVAASNRSEAEIQSDLAELITNELVIQQRRVAGDSYLFKHALVRDAAYDSMISESKLFVHKNIATAYTASFPIFCKSNPSVIAWHYSNAAIYEPAVSYGISAATLAMSQSSERYALKCLEESLTWNCNVSDIHLKNENELVINSAMIPALMVCEGYGSKAFNDIDQRSQIIFEYYKGKLKKDSHKAHAFSILWGVFLFHNNRSLRHLPYGFAVQMSDMALNNEDLQQEVFSSVVLGFCDWNEGRFVDAKQKLENAVLRYEQAGYTGEEFASKFGLDAKSWALAILSFIYMDMGYYKKTNQAIMKSINWAKQINHLGNLSYSNACQGILLFQQNDKQGVIELEKHQSELEAKYGPKSVSVVLKVPNDWAIENADFSIGFLDQYWSLELRSWVTILETILAENLLIQGTPSVALKRLQPIFEWVKSGGEQFYLAKMYLIEAKLLAEISVDKTDAIVEKFKLSMQISLEQKIYFQALQSALAFCNYISRQGLPLTTGLLDQLQIIINQLPLEHESIYLTQAKQFINASIKIN
jgi:TOMM system kinase/cyclase fusion protein